MSSNAVVIIPTYNEKNNIADILTLVDAADPHLHILFVDDNSPDGTAQKIDELRQKYENNKINILHRENKQGLGPAYIAGFTWAIEHGYQKIIQMDADLSHPAACLPTLIEQLDSYDLVIGSRYIKGGGTHNWGWLRQVISKFGSIYARLMTQIPIHDFTGGFNGWRAELLETIDYKTVNSKGYAFQIELKARAAWKKARFTEVPILFIDRAVGTSKMSKQIVFEAIYNIAKLRFSKKKYTC